MMSFRELFKKMTAAGLLLGGMSMSAGAAGVLDISEFLKEEKLDGPKNEDLLSKHLPDVFIYKNPETEEMLDNPFFETCSEAVIKSHIPAKGVFQKDFEYINQRNLTVFSALTHPKTGKVTGPLIAFDHASGGPGSFQVSFVDIRSPGSDISKPRPRDVRVKLELDRSDLLSTGKIGVYAGPKASKALQRDVEKKTESLLNAFIGCIKQEQLKEERSNTPFFSDDEPTLAMKGP